MTCALELFDIFANVCCQILLETKRKSRWLKLSYYCHQGAWQQNNELHSLSDEGRVQPKLNVFSCTFLSVVDFDGWITYECELRSCQLLDAHPFKAMSIFDLIWHHNYKDETLEKAIRLGANSAKSSCDLHSLNIGLSRFSFHEIRFFLCMLLLLLTFASWLVLSVFIQ